MTPPENPLGEAMRTRIASLLAERGIELCHVDFRQGSRRGVLTLFVDRPDGSVSLDDCETASRLAESVLDEADPLPGAYVLEVSSPGLDRPLWTLADCRRFTGRRVRVTTAAVVEGSRHFKGKLEDVQGDELLLVDEDQGRRYTVRFGDVKIARLIPEI